MRLPIPALFVVVLLAACGGDDGGERAAATSTTSSTTTSTTPASSTATSSSSTPPTCPEGEAPLAAFDLDGDGDDDVWRPAGAGAAVDIVELQAVDGCEETPVGQFAVGGSVQSLHGLRCEEGRLVELRATSDDGVRYRTEVVAWELQGAQLVEVDRSVGEMVNTDPAYVEFQSFDC